MLALIVGRGALPDAVAAAADQEHVVCAMQGQLPDTLAFDLVFRLETLGSLIADLKARGVTQACFCGSISRPAVDPSAIDAATMPLVPVLQRALQPGDDGALRALMGVFESQGIVMRGAHEIAPSLLPQPGILTAAQPDADAQADIDAAKAVLEEMARIDEGQACVLRGGCVVAQEDPGGTDAMLDQLARAQAGAGGLLVKAPKPGQDLRADLPTIGPDTARIAARAGLRGMCVQAGGVILLDVTETLRICDQAGLFLWVRDIT